jgi:hypothetical protein
MIIYNYAPDNKEFLLESIADADPLVEGNFLIPADATTVAPPELDEHEAAIYDEMSSTWSIIPDYRGVEVQSPYINGLPITIKELGVKPENVDFEVPIEPTYQQKRALAYPSIGDQLDAIMKWLATESEFGIPAELKSIAMTCMSVKAQFPKVEEDATE